MGQRKIYFGAGPAALPQEVLAEASAAILDYNGSGLSILEIAHREKAFGAILEEANALVKELAGLGDDYEVLWLQGGGRHQFAMIPMNFLGPDATAGYIDSGHWAHEAMSAARYYGGVAVPAAAAEDNYTYLPQLPATLSPNLAYLHITTNNTIYGTQWPQLPDSPVPLVADMSSDIFSMQRDYRRCALFYAVAQKNLGPSGVTLVAVRKDMLQRIVRPLPEVFSYAGQAQSGSLLNTPPVFAIYTSMLVLRWIKEKGLATLEQQNREKAALLYAEVARNPLFYSPVEADSRSLMNVVFRGRDEETEQGFLTFSKAYGIEGIKGHRSVGGFRASLYNAVTLQQVQTLVRAMQEFEANGS